MKIYLANLGKYNEGVHVGKWLELPMDECVLKKEINDILTCNGKYQKGVYEECVIQDYECGFSLDGYSNIYELNEFWEEFNNIADEKTIDALLEIVEWKELPNILRNQSFIFVHGVKTIRELALKCDTELLPFDFAAVKAAGAATFLDYDEIGLRMVANDNWHIAENGTAIQLYY